VAALLQERERAVVAGTCAASLKEECHRLNAGIARLGEFVR